MPSLSKGLRSFFFIALVCLPACAAGTANPGKTAPAASPARTVDLQSTPSSTEPAEDERNARPGINDHYFQPGGPDRYRAVLEAETREIVRRRGDIVDAIGLRKGMAVADIGAGTGVLTGEIAARVGARGRVYAVDIVPGFLDLIRSRVEDEGLRNVTVVRGKERETGLGPGSIDVAFMCDTYHHLEFPQTYMRSVFRSLRPGGTLVVVDMKRDEGESSPGVLRHVRAGKAIVIGEVEQAGFVFLSETELLEQNYYLHFRRP
ncbi:MAG: methyltransferase domain-containing protein [Myxococcales bacterium]|nr:methyltransferase domain-containing protein [Deltaproteobacteria bacterium]NNL24346.1 methyltransferase domain-containing protein [Myxococcales bacterium]